MKQKSANVPHQTGQNQAGQNDHVKRDTTKPVPPLPTVGAPLDGSQYQNIVEEQKYSAQRPTPQEQQPRRAHQDKAG